VLEKVDLSKKIGKEEFKPLGNALGLRLGALQRQARDLGIPIIIVLEGWDAAGKGVLINELILPLDPRGFNVYPIGEPTEEEQQRPFLWRYWTKTPPKSRIAIFDCSWYRSVLTDRIDGVAGEHGLRHTFQSIPAFERQLADDGTLIIKFFLHISKKEQKERLEKLHSDPSAAWRVTKADWKHHQEYDQYLAAIEEMFQKTDTGYAPWTIIEAQDRRFATIKILTTVIGAIESRISAIQNFQLCTAADGATSPDPLLPVAETAVDSPAAGLFLHSSIIRELDLSQTVDEEDYQDKLKKYQDKIRDVQFSIYRKQRPVIIVFEGWDSAGKGGAIRRLTQNMDPRGYTVIPTTAPNDEEKAHHYLWRFWKTMPKAGHIAIFDRSWYGRVLVERVEGFCGEAQWRRAYREINEMEEQWVAYDAIVIKFWLQISKDEQKKRFEERLANPDKQWKINGEDWRNRDKWAQYEEAIDEMFFRTSTTHAPWTIVEANSKYFSRLKVLKTVLDTVHKNLTNGGR
jgi:polyphosphate:AMP phosphotransferase